VSYGNIIWKISGKKEISLRNLNELVHVIYFYESQVDNQGWSMTAAQTNLYSVHDTTCIDKTNYICKWH